MFRSYLAAALRNLARNRLYAAVTILGLAIGFAAAMLIGLYVRDELTFDRFVPGHERVYLFSETLQFKTAAPIDTKLTQMTLARTLKADFPQIQYVSRLAPSYFPPTVRHGEITAGEQGVYWGDPDFFRIFPLPVVAGDLATALEPADGVVLTRAMARKYFGRDAPLGETLLIDRQPFRVTAVVQDLPSNTHLTADIIASARAPQSTISQYEHINGPSDTVLSTYIRLRPGASPAGIEARLSTYLDERLPMGAVSTLGQDVRTLHLIPLTRIHLSPTNQEVFNTKGAVDPAILMAIGAVGVLIVVVAAINFVTLMTARASRRAVEVGVRKAAGASRGDLILQFMGEALLYVAAAAVLALSLAELLMPAVNAFLQRKMRFDYLHDPGLGLGVLAALVVIGLLAGAYPAFVLSAFRPSAVLKGGATASVGGNRVRQALVVAQFAVLIVLVLVAMTMARQTVYALNEGMRLDKDQVLLVFSQPCLEAMRDETRKIPGVKAAGCAGATALNLSNSNDAVTANGRMHEQISQGGVDAGFFETFGIRPIAGRLFETSRPSDFALDAPDSYQPVILNETAVRKLGFASPQAAVGQTVLWHGAWDATKRTSTTSIPPLKPSQVVGVVPDFTLGSVRQQIPPTMYAVIRNVPPDSVAMVVKLDGRRIPETMAAIQSTWKRVGEGRPFLSYFADRFTMRLYLDTIIQGTTVAVAGVIALTIAALGLFALSAYMTERRTKEIGVRKAMGASSGDILKLLLWQFTKPVIWANLIAWPAAWLMMRWWLSSFAYHVDLAPWTFVAAGLGALVIAWATVFAHALNVARSKPVAALRYE